MELDKLLQQQRDNYITFFQSALEEYKTELSASETLLKITSEENKHLPEVFQLYRYDLITKNNEGKFDITEFNLDKASMLDYKEQFYEIKEVKIAITPFVWNGCEFLLDKLPANIDSYINWAIKWINVTEENMNPINGLDNVVHSVTYPQEFNGFYNISIDFGTASISAFKELLSIFSNEKIRRVMIHSSFFINQQA